MALCPCCLKGAHGKAAAVRELIERGVDRDRERRVGVGVARLAEIEERAVWRAESERCAASRARTARRRRRHVGRGGRWQSLLDGRFDPPPRRWQGRRRRGASSRTQCWSRRCRRSASARSRLRRPVAGRARGWASGRIERCSRQRTATSPCKSGQRTRPRRMWLCARRAHDSCVFLSSAVMPMGKSTLVS